MMAKPAVISEVLKLNYSVLFSDLDTVWIRPALPAFLRGIEQRGADAAGAFEHRDEGGAYIINTGNLFLRSSDRTKRMVGDWMRYGTQDGGAALRTDILGSEQTSLGFLRGTSWESCDDMKSCSSW